MNYADLEDAIVTRLAPIVTAGHEVESMPSIPSENRGVQHRGRITVFCASGKYNDKDVHSQTNTTVQDEFIYAEITIRAKRLRSSQTESGVQELKNLAQRILLGWKPPNCFLPMKAVEYTPSNPALVNGMWEFVMVMMTATVAIGDEDADVSVLLQQITLLPSGGVGVLVPTAEIFSSAYSVDNSGDQVTIAWITDNAESVEITGIGIVEPIGSATVTITADTTFEISATRGGTVATAQVEVTVGVSCLPVTNKLNGVTIDTTASGGTFNQEVTDSAGNPVGTAANPSVVANTQIRSTNDNFTDSELAEGTYTIADVDWTDTDGSPMSTEYGQPITCSAVTPPSLTIGVFSDAGLTTPVTSGNNGSTVYIKANPTGITPTSYTFSIDGSTDKIVTQAGDTYAWTIDIVGAVAITARATDGTGATANATAFSFTANLVIDKAISFDGVNDYTYSWFTPQQNTSFSVTMRVKMNNTALITPMFSINEVGAQRDSFGICFNPTGNVITVHSWNAHWNTYTIGSITPDTNWHHLAVTFDSATNYVRVYWDGVLIGTRTSAGNYGYQKWQLFALARAHEVPYVGGKYGNMSIADPAIHNVTLSQVQVTALQTLGVVSGNEVQHYPVTEAIGTTTGYIADMSGTIPMQLINITSPNGVKAYP